MSIKERLVGWLLDGLTVSIDQLCNAIEEMDVNADGRLSLRELVTGVMRMVR